MLNDSYDCVVIGAGCFGSWTALRLREGGRSVALLDAFGPGNQKSSSGGASRIIRMAYGADEIYTRWSWDSLSAWKDLFERVRRPELFQPTGVLWTARQGHPHAAGARIIFRELAIPHETLTAREVCRRYPQLHFDTEVVGILEPESGALLANQAVRAVAGEAARIGVDMMTARVTAPAGRMRLDFVRTEDGRTIAAETFVFACGPWLPKLFPEVIAGRILVTRQPVFYFDVPAYDMPIWIDFSDPRGAYTFPPLAGKGFKLALDQHGPEFDPDTGSRNATPTEIAAAREFLSERFPALAGVPLVESEVCQYENTCNGDLLIDQHPELSNVWLAGGGSGHGFKHGPMVGEYVVRMLDGEEPEPRLSWAAKSQVFGRTVY